LVDNDFEEHVLEYSKEEDGLYLHGINANSIEFNSWSSEKVNEVAKRFNLIPVEYKIFNDVHGNNDNFNNNIIIKNISKINEQKI